MTSPETEKAEVRHHSKRLGREIAMQFLFACEMQHATPGAAIFDSFFETAKEAFAIDDSRLERRGKEYAVKLYTITEVNREEIDKLIVENSRNWSFDRISGVDRNILRVAVAEMLFCDNIPNIVSIDEAVGIARDYSGVDSGNFVNGLLNAIKEHISGKEKK